MRRDEDEALEDEDARRWQRVKTALAEALELPPEGRAAMLAELRGRDPALAEELASLLAAHDQTRPQLMGLAPGVVDALVREHADALRLGQPLGAYRLVRRIGSGGMGDVYLGERADGAFEKQVAIKVLRDGLVGEGAVLRFERERQILARLDHANLAKVFDGGVTGQGLPYFVMELVDGRPLTDYCDAHDLNVRERVALMRAVCQVVHYVHQRGVIHRDLKPRNILVTPEGQIKLVDFGIAKLIEPLPEAARDETVTALRAMTPLYSSPEQVRGQAVGPASDVYALGVVLCRLLAGRSPYDLETTTAASFELARAICEEEPLRLSEAAAGQEGAMPPRLLRGDLDAVVAKALRKDPAARYPSAEHMADDLFRHLERLPVGARRGATGYRLGRWLVRHRAVAAGALVANLALVAGLALALDQAHEARLQRQNAQQASAKVRSLANLAMFEVHDEIAKLPGSIDARKWLVEKALAYLAALEADAPGDATLALDLARSYRRLGDIQGRPNWANLGDFEGALASYKRSATLLQALVGRGLPVTPIELDLERVATLGRQAAVLSYTAHRDSARQAAEQALALLDEAAAQAPGDTRVMTATANVHGLLSWVLHESGDAAGFLAHATACELVLSRLLSLKPDDDDTVDLLVTAYARRGVYHLERDRSTQSAQQALEPLQKWVALAEKRSARSPQDAGLAGSLAEGRTYLSLALQRTGEPARAAAVLRRSTEQLASIARLNARDEHLAFNLMNSRIALARVLLDQKDAAGAAEQARQALATYEESPPATQGSTMHLHTAAEAHFVAGRAATGPGGPPGPEACQHFRASRSLLQRIPDELPSSNDGELSRQDVEAQLARCAA
ncbi:protein kinase domain-containing protein [Ideonella sp. YS5]|uniref:serine/threonine-protein kinase n=1 Tax=Ideonella sp. YS5 TaxID=3453714 RepID=UPI003EEC0EEB